MKRKTWLIISICIALDILRSPEAIGQTYDPNVVFTGVTFDTTAEFNISFTLTILNNISIKNLGLQLTNFISQESFTVPWTDTATYSNGSKSFKVPISDYERFKKLRPGAWQFLITYTKTAGNVTTNTSQNLGFCRKLDFGQLDVYQINKISYKGLPVFALYGGMSAEYTVEKSLSCIAGGISHTWGVRKLDDGTPDLKGGGPISVYSSQDFLNKSINQTVKSYNDYLGDTTIFPTVIISTGVPAVNYLSFAMKAPVLPLHFLASVNSINEVKHMVDVANQNGYSCYATAGYDPSILHEGVAWIKLLDLPAAYKQFLEDHHTTNVILLGLDEKSIGEISASRIIFPGNNQNDYAPGSVYLMRHGGNEGDSILRAYYKDLDQQSIDTVKNIADWEGGITELQIENFKKSLPPFRRIPYSVYSITAKDPVDFYNLVSDLMLHCWKINPIIYRGNPVDPNFHGVELNEYLIGNPDYEYTSYRIPFYYWQGLPPYLTAFRLMGGLKIKTLSLFPNVDYVHLNFDINAKADRSPLLNYLDTVTFKGVTPKNVTMNTWQKADVWDPSDGMNAPCEKQADDIVNNLTVYGFQESIRSMKPIDVTYLSTKMASKEKEQRDVAASHPQPDSINPVKDFEEYGFVIDRENYGPNKYWQYKNYPSKVLLYDRSSKDTLGFIDMYLGVGEQRRQRVTRVKLDLNNTSDEFDLRIGYKFNPKPSDGFKSYDPAKGTQQNMNCFENVSVPANDWMDIPSRVMAREGAVLIVNGTVYDFDYNGLPGVVPFIKINNNIKAKPQILSFKGEACFAWNWGVNKKATLFPRQKEVPGTNMQETLSNLFQQETNTFPNAMSGMTYMTGNELYDIKSLQPQWMIQYPSFSDPYLATSGTALRCYLSNFDTAACKSSLAEYGGDPAPKEEGWNDCTSLMDDAKVQRISSLAYQQYPASFDYVANARTFVAQKGNELTIGISDGDLGNPQDYRGVYLSKTMGFRNWELSNYSRYKKYDRLLNLDGGSSTQMWLNGRGPLQYWGGYPLKDDNQGPYYSRLVSSFLMLVPKFHTDQIKKELSENKILTILDNSDISFNYDDNVDGDKDKAFISLSPCLDKLSSDDGAGIMAGWYGLLNNGAKGAILFYKGEDAYYPDTRGKSRVIPQLRNLTTLGAGSVPRPLLDSLLSNNITKNWGTDGLQQSFLESLKTKNKWWWYYIDLNNGVPFFYGIPTDHWASWRWSLLSKFYL